MEETQDTQNERLDIDKFKKFGIDNAQIIIEHNRKRRKKQSLSKCAIEWRKRYALTEKGKEQRRQISARRAQRMKEASKDLTDDEKEEIEDFYRKKPFGMHVDHIIPIAKGGKHCLSNLHYVPPKENLEKASRLDYYDPPRDFSSIAFNGIPYDPPEPKKRKKRGKYIRSRPIVRIEPNPPTKSIEERQQDERIHKLRALIEDVIPQGARKAFRKLLNV